MTDHKLNFKISNIPDSFTGFLIFVSVLFFICGGGLILSGAISGLPDWSFGIIFLLLLTLAFGTPFLITAGMKTTVDYDGKHVKLKSFFSKSEISLEHVKSVRYWHERGTGRSPVDSIVLEFVFFEKPDEPDDSVTLYADLRNNDFENDLDKLIKGDHSSFPLLQMYDDIIELYPDKKCDSEEDQAHSDS